MNYEELNESVVINDEECIAAQETAAQTVYGEVANCRKLNIREKPDINSKVVTVVPCSEKLNINLEDSKNEWLAVCTVAGIEGFCMKEFIEIME
jgi:uncharacterized protein YgiM (DUF1202 family)